MADGKAYTSTPDEAAGNPIDVEEVTTSKGTVDRQRVRLAGVAAAELADVKNAEPATSAYGVITRNIPADASVSGGAVAGSQVTAANTATQLMAAPLANARSAMLQADSANSENARIGGSTVDGTHGIELQAGQSMTIEDPQGRKLGDALLQAYYAWSSGGTAKINILQRS